MGTKSQDRALSTLNVAIEALNLAKEVSGIAPAKAVFSSVSDLLGMIRIRFLQFCDYQLQDSMVNKTDYVELGLACAGVCKALDRGTNGRRLDELTHSVREAIAQLTTTVAEIQEKIIEKGGRNIVSRVFHAKNDKESIAGWNLDLNRILHVFNTELAINTHMMVSDLHRNALTSQEGTGGQHSSTQASISLGELPPPPPRACFGRDELIEKIIGFADNLTPFALIGAGGIGKTSIALTVLYHDRISQRFGDDRRFIRCDQIPASRAHFLNRLSKVIGVGIENPEDLTPLRSFLSSREMIIFLDNAEPILDPRGPNAREIYAVVEELSQLKTVCLCITSRISTVPRHCERPIIPTLSMESAYDIFYGIYNNGGRSDTISDLLKQLDFHALSITLLATVASHNMWDYNRLAQEWDAHRTQVLWTDYNESLAATIELSLASPTFRELGPEAREFLGINAFFPQGIGENNLNWLFPTIPDRRNIFDKFCVLSLAYRSNGFIVMLAPLRDYFHPKDPASFPLLCMAKDCYLRLLSVDGYPGKPNYEEVQCITSEDVNVEYLLDIFTSIDANSVSVWDACAHFMGHLYWQKSRLVVLGQKVEGLPDDHPSKPECLFQLSWLFGSVGNYVEEKRLVVRALKLWREGGNDLRVAEALWSLSGVNRLLGLQEEGIQRAKEALEIYKRFNDIPGQAQSLYDLAWLLHDDDQLNAAEEVALQAIDLLPDKGEQFRVCRCHRVLGEIYSSKGETKRAIYHYDTALGIASHFNWHQQLFWVHDSLAVLFFDEKRFDDAHSHIEHAKSYAIKNRAQYPLGRAMYLQAQFWYKEHSFEEAKSEASRAADVLENLGITKELEYCRELLRDIEMKRSITSGESNTKARGTRNHLASVFRHILPRRTTGHI